MYNDSHLVIHGESMYGDSDGRLADDDDSLTTRNSSFS